jgi:hypothetical protein
MTSPLTITHPSINSGNPVTVRAQSIRIAGTKKLDTLPNANLGAEVTVQVVNHENLKYMINGVHFTGEANSLTYAQLLTLYRSATAATLFTSYGVATSLVGFDGTTTSIPVQLQSFDFPIDVSITKSGYMPIANLVFVETI